MSHKKRKRRITRRRRTTSLSAAPRKTHTRRRRRKGLLHDKGALVSSVKANAAAAAGGVLLSGIEMLPIQKPWLKVAAGFGAAVLISSFAKMPNVAAGLSGATAYVAAKTMLPGFLHDALQGVEYVDPSTLCDSGYVDEEGNAVLQSSQTGAMYALHDSGELHELGNAYSLHDNAYSLHDEMQSVAMLPLSDPYSLHDRFSI